MPALSDPTTWRSGPYSRDTYVWVHNPPVVFQAQVNQSSFTYPLLSVTYDNAGVYDYNDIKEGQTVLFGTTPGADDLGRQRVRRTPGANQVANSDTLFFGRSSRGVQDGEVNLQDNAYITVLDLRQIWSVVPYITPQGVMYKDGEVSFNANKAQPPVANAGPDLAAFVDPDTSTLTVDFGQTASYTMHPDANGTLTYAWDFVDGTPSSSTDAAPTGVSFPPGRRYISLTVTDSLSNTHTAYALIAALEPGDTLSQYTVSEHKATVEGQTVSIDIYEDVHVPDGSEVLIFKSERYGTTRTDGLAGLSGREAMLFSGWIQSESADGRATGQGFIGRGSLVLVDTAGRLRTLPGFSQTMERDSAPTSWYQMETANIDRYVHFLLHWHTTAFNRSDFIRSGTGNTYAFPTLESGGGNLYEQADTVTQAIAYKLTCDRYNRLAMLPDPQLRDSRTSTIIVALTESDWERYQYTYTRPPRVHWNWGEAIVAAATDADNLTNLTSVFCVAPGSAPGQGVQSVNSTRQVVLSQDDLNTREGHRYAARMNNRYGYIALDLVRGGDAWIDPALMEWVTVDISSETAGPRGRTLTAKRGLPVEVRYQYDNERGTARQTVVVEVEQVGTPAQTYVPPVDKGFTLPTLIGSIFPPLTISLPPLPGQVLPSFGTDLMGIAAPDGIWVTDDFTTPSGSGGPTWTQVAAVNVSTDGYVISFMVDPFSPSYQGTGSAVHGWVLTSKKIGRVLDIFGTASLTWVHNTYCDTPYGVIRAERAQQNWVIAVQRGSVAGSPATNANVAMYSTDGVNFTNVEVSEYASFPSLPALSVSSGTPGLAYTFARISGVSTTGVAQCARFATTDFGATWFENGFVTGHIYPSNLLHVPKGSPSNTFWAETRPVSEINTNPVYHLKRNSVDIGPTYSGSEYSPRNHRAFATDESNPNFAVYCGQVPYTSTYATFKTSNALADTPSWSVFQAPSPELARVYVLNELTYVFVGENNDRPYVGICTDGNTVDDRSGNLTSVGFNHSGQPSYLGVSELFGA